MIKNVFLNNRGTNLFNLNVHKFPLKFLPRAHFTSSLNKQTLVEKNTNKTFAPIIYKYFSTSTKVKEIKFSRPSQEEMMNRFNEEFEKALQTGEEDKDKRVKLLSIKLLQLNKSSDVINLFDEKYIKGLINKIFGEELSLIIYFYASLLEREKRENNPNLYNKENKISIDKRLDKVLSILEEKLDELDLTNLMALTWSISVLISKFSFEINQKFKTSLINQLPTRLDIDKKGEVPTLCYSLSTFSDEEDVDLNKVISERVISFSSLFFSEKGLNYHSSLNLSLLCISWARLNLKDSDLLDRTVDALLEIKENLNEENIEEICKIIWTFSTLNYQNDKIKEFLRDFLEQWAEKININNIIDLFISSSSICPENVEIMEILAHSISRTVNDFDMILDINSYINIWLGLSKYYVKSGENSFESVALLIKFMLSQYDKRKYLSVSNMSEDEVCSLLVCFSILDLEPNKIYKDIGTYIKSNIRKFNNTQLIQLISCGRYLFNSKAHSDLYFIIHDACVTSKETFDTNQIKVIKRILTRDAIITESYFLNR